MIRWTDFRTDMSRAYVLYLSRMWPASFRRHAQRMMRRRTTRRQARAELVGAL